MEKPIVDLDRPECLPRIRLSRGNLGAPELRETKTRSEQRERFQTKPRQQFALETECLVLRKVQRQEMVGTQALSKYWTRPTRGLTGITQQADTARTRGNNSLHAKPVAEDVSCNIECNHCFALSQELDGMQRKMRQCSARSENTSSLLWPERKSLVKEYSTVRNAGSPDKAN